MMSCAIVEEGVDLCCVSDVEHLKQVCYVSILLRPERERERERGRERERLKSVMSASCCALSKTKNQGKKHVERKHVERLEELCVCVLVCMCVCVCLCVCIHTHTHMDPQRVACSFAHTKKLEKRKRKKAV